MTKFNPTKISEIKKIWEDEGFTLKKSLSQNFLIDQNVVSKIVDAANVKAGDVVLEIGPGSGALTVEMLKRGAIVYAVEYDARASAILEKYLKQDENFHLINQDILATDLSFLKPGAKIVSNLPYHITSPIIAKIASLHGVFTDIIIMVQKEMAERILSKAPSTNRSSFSIFTSFYFKKKSLFLVKPGCFIPKPKVDSVILSLTPKSTLPLKDPDPFFAFVRKAFSQKRKMISSVLKEYDIPKALEAIDCNPKARPEQLSLQNFLDLWSSV
ncbi:MAG: Ribosomal RNA small subunit methyltransferase A [Chlamydiia bacterium]|nr:Ribosomal RNA small subunit methyltransferase A [Chlamydiia bacterium]MCH9618432.1 Ribosomal RNA small subunit methyltransferase A [Chlamydiia bacterium]MCH9623758.1 Ribosomal RNA small subunit methyltransferase A [Chlamydiia bacterium]